MIPILYPSSTTVFDTNGLGILTDASACRVSAELNGKYELAMTYDNEGLHAADITDRQIILAKPDPTSRPQPFRVYRVDKSSKGTMSVYARHIAYDMQGIPIGPVTADNAVEAVAAATSAASVPCPFIITTNISAVSQLDTKSPRPLWKLLAGSDDSLLGVYGGEYEFDVWTVRLLKRRGGDNGVSIRYGKNLTSLVQDRNCAGCYTGVEPFWLGQDGQLVRLPEKVIKAEGTYGYTNIYVLDLSSEWQVPPTVDQLRLRADRYIQDNNIGVPAVSWKGEFVQLEQTEEYKGTAILERISLGDTVSVEFPKMHVSASARAVATEYDVLLDRYVSVTLGKVQSNLADTIVAYTEQGKNAMREVRTERLSRQQAIEQLQTALAESSGMFATDIPQEDGSTIRYLHDKTSLDASANVIKITAEAIGFSTDGGKTYPAGISINGDVIARVLSATGIDADWINVGCSLLRMKAHFCWISKGTS